MYKHIMLPIEDDALSTRAVSECFSLAKSIGAKVTVLHVVPHAKMNVPIGFTSQIVDSLKKQREEEEIRNGQKLLSDVEERARTAGIACDNVVVVGDNPYEEIIENAEKNHCDLILMASHARRGLDAMLFGSETARVLRHTKLPVLVVR